MSSLFAKILEVQAKAPVLRKSSSNDEAGFRYASIDEYYEKIVPVAREAGLLWIVTERMPPAIESYNGEDYARFFYNFEVMTSGAEPEETYPINLSILHPLQGAQTSGSAMSYADKLLMRTLFKVATGEPDADAFARSKKRKPSVPEEPAPVTKRSSASTVSAPSDTFLVNKAPPSSTPSPWGEEEATEKVPDDAPPPPLLPPQRAARRASELIAELRKCKTRLDCKVWRKNNDADLSELEEVWPEEYTRIEKAWDEVTEPLRGSNKEPQRG